MPLEQNDKTKETIRQKLAFTMMKNTPHCFISSLLKKSFLPLAVCLAFVFTFSFTTNSVRAAEENNVQARLISGHIQVSPGQSFYLALRLAHKKHWHTYWHNPGDSGQPPEIEWQNTSGLTPGNIIWPTPEVIPTPPLMTYGYQGEVYMPVKITLPQDFNQNQVIFSGTARWLECKDICLPASKDVSVSLDVGDAPRTNAPQHKAIKNTLLERVPRPASDWQMSAIYTPEVLALTFKPNRPEQYRNSDFRFLPHETGIINNSAPQQVSFNQESGGYTLRIQRDDFTQRMPDTLKGIVIYEKHKAIAFSAPTSRGSVADISTEDQGLALAFLIALGLAFVGGLILNLMPCVLPVLALKVTHLVAHAQKEAPWHHGVAFAVGVVSTFLVLAGLLIFLQAGGQALGWGFQLQNPVFVLIMSIILLAVAMDLMGVFTIGAGLSRLGGKEEQVAGKTGSFLTGVLATVVATPCTAPFMGTALAYTLGKPAAITLTIFAVLGLGLATPYVLLTAFPKLLRLIPKPGTWMITFKQILAFPILATILWLLWVLGGQVGPDGITLGMLVLLVVAFALWLWGRFGQNLMISRTRAVAVFVVALALICTAGYMGAAQLQTLDKAYSKATGSQENAEYTPFRPGLPEELQRKGQASFVIFTADWCITCKVNERMVLDTPPVRKAFAENNIEVIVADWTRRDDTIGRALKKHGRAGVPFYLYYPPEPSAAPEPLPELLTQDIVLGTVND